MREIKNGYERILEFREGFYKRDPDPAKNYGIGGMSMRFVLKGKEGAVSFMLYTSWHPESTHQKACLPMPADICYHSLKPQYDGQTICREACEYCDGKPCYCDGSSLNAEAPFIVLKEKGEEAPWAYLEEYYKKNLLDENPSLLKEV